jgi:prepilin-type N-terminal cleavage/methylation domain-containing protein
MHMTHEHGGMSRRRHGFTLVELLVVIAIIGVLVGLLLPAVQAAREASRRTSCGNKIRQLGLAALNYHDVRNKLPYTHRPLTNPGANWNFNDPHHKGSFLVRLLPFIERNDLYEQINFDANLQDVENQVIGGKALYAHVIPQFVCPSDTHQGTAVADNGETRAVSNYSGSMGSQANAPCGTHNNYFGNGPVVRADTGNGAQVSGVISHIWWSATLNDITDGTSKTILLGEVRPQCEWHVRRGWAHINAMYTGTGSAINFNTCEGEPGSGTGCNQYRNQWGASQGFKSRHPGGAFFVMCDGSAVFLQESIDMVAYQALGDRRDGTVLDAR